MEIVEEKSRTIYLPEHDNAKDGSKHISVQRYDRPKITKVLGFISNDVGLSMILVLMHKTGMTYTDLKCAVGLYSRSASGRFAYYLRKSERCGLVHHVSQAHNRYELTPEGRLVAVLVDNLINPSSPWLEAARVGPALIQTVNRINEAMEAARKLNQSMLPPPVDPKFSAPTTNMTESEVQQIVQIEDIKRKVAKASNPDDHENIIDFAGHTRY